MINNESGIPTSSIMDAMKVVMTGSVTMTLENYDKLVRDSEKLAIIERTAKSKSRDWDIADAVRGILDIKKDEE